MINTEFNFFTADEAIDAGLIEALQDGFTVISGTYKFDKDGILKYDQKNFVFKDKNNQR